MFIYKDRKKTTARGDTGRKKSEKFVSFTEGKLGQLILPSNSTREFVR